jgi:hypothetical protein
VRHPTIPHIPRGKSLRIASRPLARHRGRFWMSAAYRYTVLLGGKKQYIHILLHISCT